MKIDRGDDVRVLWLLTAVLLIGGFAYVQMNYQNKITATYRRAQTLYRETLKNRRVIRRSAALQAIRRRARADLSRISGETSISASTANLLGTLQASERRFHAKITRIEPGDAAGLPGEKVKTLRATPLTIHVSGRFRGILRLIEDLSHHATLVSVRDTEMALAKDGAEASEPRLDATVHAVLYRLGGRTAEGVHAPAR